MISPFTLLEATLQIQWKKISIQSTAVFLWPLYYATAKDIYKINGQNVMLLSFKVSWVSFALNYKGLNIYLLDFFRQIQRISGFWLAPVTARTVMDQNILYLKLRMSVNWQLIQLFIKINKFLNKIIDWKVWTLFSGYSYFYPIVFKLTKGRTSL